MTTASEELWAMEWLAQAGYATWQDKHRHVHTPAWSMAKNTLRKGWRRDAKRAMGGCAAKMLWSRREGE